MEQRKQPGRPLTTEEVRRTTGGGQLDPTQDEPPVNPLDGSPDGGGQPVDYSSTP